MYALRALALSVFFLLPSLTHAATLTFGGAGSSAVGSTLSVPVTVSAASGESLNAISANISYPTDKLSLVSIAKSPSIITLWTQEPAFSNTSGTAALEGLVPNPGFSGAQGTVATLVFRVTAPGVATLSFVNTSVHANDGQGTNILRSAPSRTVTLTAGTLPAKTMTLSSSAFSITSDTHPDEHMWYKSSSGRFTWTVPPGATATRLLLSRDPSATPSVLYEPAIGAKTIEEMPDGVSYLLVQHRVAGEWGGIGRYRVQVDTTGPRGFTITFPHGATDINPQPIILFNTLDEDSGIDHYEVQVSEGGPLLSAAPADSNPYTLPPQEPGAHVVVVTAYDKAGNATTRSAEFFVEGIEPPIFTYYLPRVPIGDLVRLQGTTYENAEVNVYIRKDGEVVSEEFARSSPIGQFGLLVTKRLESGTYTATARVTDARGARSAESESITFVIEGNFLGDLIILTLNYLSAGIILLVTFVAFSAVGIYAVFMLMNLRRSLMVRRLAAEHRLHTSFEDLEKRIEERIRILRKERTARKLTRDELAFLEEFGADLKEVEEELDQELAGFSDEPKKNTHRRRK